MRRYPQSKGRGARSFNHRSAKTKAINMAPPPMRGGYRL